MPADAPMVLVSRDLVSFLLGEGPLDGLWFGETKPIMGGRMNAAFWWRTNLREATDDQESLSASPAREGLGVSASPIPTEGHGAAVVGWRPIETAPKDGTRVLLAILGDSGHYAQQVGSWAEERLNDEPDGWEWPWSTGTPTHWMPLPPAPSTTSTAEQVREDWSTDSYRAIALQLCKTVEGLITGLPDLLETGDLKDEEGLIDEAFRTLDTTAFRLAQLDLEAEESAPSPGEGDAPVAWRALTEIADRPLIKEPKQGDYGKDRERCPSCGHAWHVDEEPHHAPTCDRMVAVAARREMALASRPTPATPEGLREKVAEHADLIEWLRTVEAQVQQYGHCTISDVSHRKLARILAALQPQAQGGRGERGEA